MLGSQASASGSASALGSFAVPRLPMRGMKRNDVIQTMSRPRGNGKGKEKAQEDNTDKWTEW